jgi:hypothetical protein
LAGEGEETTGEEGTEAGTEEAAWDGDVRPGGWDMDEREERIREDGVTGEAMAPPRETAWGECSS